MRVRGMYARDPHNVTIDMLTRAKHTEIQQWTRYDNFEWKEPGRAWVNFPIAVHLGEAWHIDGVDPDRPAEPWAPHGLAVEWNPPSFTMCIEALKYGLAPAYLHPRNPSVARLMSGVAELDDSPRQFPLTGGPVRSEFEILVFQSEVDRLGPMGGSAYSADRSGWPR